MACHGIKEILAVHSANLWIKMRNKSTFLLDLRVDLTHPADLAACLPLRLTKMLLAATPARMATRLISAKDLPRARQAVLFKTFGARNAARPELRSGFQSGSDREKQAQNRMKNAIYVWLTCST